MDETLDCPAAQEYSRAYLHHLIRAGEYLGSMLLSWYNIAYFEHLTARMRAAIAAGTFADFRRDFRAKWDAGRARADTGESPA